VQASGDQFESRLPLAEFDGKVTTNRVCGCFPLRQFPDHVHNLGFENRSESWISLHKKWVEKFSSENQLGPLPSKLQFATKQPLVLRDVVRCGVRKPHLKRNNVQTGSLS
jgi:hypothetical protein